MHRLNVHYLKHSLDKLCYCLDELYNINRGGCCYIAYLIARHLDKLGMAYDLTIYDYRGRDVLDINHEVTNMLKHTTSKSSVIKYGTCAHYCISLTGGGYVNKGDVDGLNQYIVKGVTCKNIGWIYQNGFWNKEYDTRNNKTVKGIIDSFFKNYE